MKSTQYFAHPNALVESHSIGKGTRIWAFAHVLPGAQIGENCNIGDHCFVESDVIIGNDVVIKNGVSVWNRVTLEDIVFVGPNVVFTNDLYPRAKIFHENYVPTLIQKGASIGANATLVCGIKVGQYAMIGAGSVVIRDVGDFTLVVGNPAKIKGYICKCGTRLSFTDSKAICQKCQIKYQINDDQIMIV